jgi:hypothetical protein
MARRRNTNTATSNTGVLYVTVTASGNMTLSGVPGFASTIPSAVQAAATTAGAQFFVAYYGSQSGQTPAAQSPAWVSSSTTGAAPASSITIPAVTTPTFTLTSGQSVYFVLYYGYYIPVNNSAGCVGVQPDAAQRQLVGVTPATPGSTWSYTGTLTDVIARNGPCPLPTASSAATVGVNVTVTSTPGMPPGFVDEQSVESDSYSTNTTQVTTNAIINGTVEASETSTDLTGNQVVTTYASPYLTYLGSSNFTNDPPSTVNTTFADGTTYQQTYASNGTYSETDTLVGVAAAPNTITTNADGSASYNIYNGYYGTTLAVTMSAPSGGAITFTTAQGGQSSNTLTIPAWFSANPTLYSDSTAVTTGASLDPSCTGSGLLGGGSSATEYLRTISTIDPALGGTETETIKSYVVPDYTGSTTVGPVCVVISDVQDLYYDFLLDTPYLAYVSGTGSPLQTNTFNETFYFSSAPTGESRVRTDAAARAAANLALHESGIAFARAVQRAQRMQRFERAVLAGQFKGVTR